MAKVLTKSQIIQAIADAHKDKLARKDVAGVLQSLATIGYKELKKNGLFVLPGLREVRRHQEARHQGAPGDQPVHQGADDLQGEAGPQGAEGPPGEGRQGRSVRNPSPTSPCFHATLAGRGFVDPVRRQLVSAEVVVVRLNRIYTKAGDGGDTRLVGGQKVRKDALRIEAYGTVDELSACIGIARTALTRARRARGGGRARARCWRASRTSSSTWGAIWRRCPPIATRSSR